jgi:MerR family transcriptional regulator, light-induced transcriptional regulator
MSEAELTLQDAADLLGVHYMTAYRYVRLGELPATKVGGSWRVQRHDVEAFRSGESAVAVIDRGARRAPWAQRLEQRLLAGDARGSWGVIEAALAAGTELDEIYLDVLAPAMASIGQRWVDGELEIADEHIATGIATRIVGRLGPRFVRRGRSRGTVVMGAPAGERHSLPVSVVSDLVRLAGWDVLDLGADSPAGSFARAALSSDDVVAVGVSVTTPVSLAAAAEALAAVRDVAPSVVLLAGGAAIVDGEHALSLGADHWARDARSMVALLDEVTAAARAKRVV